MRTPRAEGGPGTIDGSAGAWSEGTVGRWYSPATEAGTSHSETSGFGHSVGGGASVFRAACPDCGSRFVLTAAALRLVLGASHRTTFYSFTCPDCGSGVRKPAGERIVELLTGGGVRTLRLHTTV